MSSFYIKSGNKQSSRRGLLMHFYRRWRNVNQTSAGEKHMISVCVSHGPPAWALGLLIGMNFVMLLLVLQILILLRM